MIREIAVNCSGEWNSIVKSFEDYDVFYLNEYVVAFMNEDEKNGEPLLLYYCEGEDEAIEVVFKRDIAKDSKFKGKIEENKFYDLITPYGYGGFWGRISDYEKLNQAYNEYCVKNNYICEFVRFELFSEYYKKYDGEVETRTHNVVRELESSLDEIWMDFKQKVRKNVKKAASNNLQILLDDKGTYIQDFLGIYYSTMDRNSAEAGFYFSREFFETINGMADNFMYFYALYEGKIVSAELVIYGSENCYSYLGGTKREYFDVRPNDFLKYEIIKWAKGKRLKRFVLGGGYGTDDGIFQYKACLAPKGIVDYYIGRKIFDTEKYNELVSMRAVDSLDCMKENYFPQYRA